MGLNVLGKFNKVGRPEPEVTTNSEKVIAPRIAAISRNVEVQKKPQSTEWRAEKPGRKSSFLQDMLSENE